MIIYNLLAFKIKNSGAGKFALNSLNYLSMLNEEKVIVLTHLTFSDFSKSFKCLDENKKIKLIRFKFCKNPILRIIFETMFLSLYVRFKFFKGIFYSPLPYFSFLKFKNFKYISTVHDLTPFRISNKYGFLKRVYVKWITKMSILFSDKVITVSEFSKNELISFFDKKRIEIDVLYNVIPYSEEEFIPNKKKVLFFVGNIHEGKNLINLIEGFEIFCDKYDNSYELHLVGKEEYNSAFVYEKIENSKYQNKIILKGFVPVSTLIDYYKYSSGMIFPSINEGFGVPIIEALKYKCPMSLAEASVFPEVAGKCAFYFDPLNVNSISESIFKLIYDNESLNYKLSLYELQLKKFDVDINKFKKIIF